MSCVGGFWWGLSVLFYSFFIDFGLEVFFIGFRGFFLFIIFILMIRGFEVGSRACSRLGVRFFSAFRS